MKALPGIFYIVLIFATQWVHASPEIKGNPEDLRAYFHPTDKTIFIKDEAEETAYTDVAIINLIVKTEHKELAKAIQSNAVLRQKIATELTTNGVLENHIKNSKFSSSPQYGWFGSKPTSYEVLNRVAVTISNEKQLEHIASIADRHEEISLSGTSFKHSKKLEFEQQVKKNALEKVLKKKAFYEKSLGVKLSPISFSESDVDFAATQGANRFEEEIIVTGVRESKDSAYSKRRASSSSQESSFDEVKYRAVITVEFKVN
ncbi:hypothetical protein TDB9533_03453 [Thalassocella blandensis]|nr:hypothetical protein TDB9533_03453 [Thalassocella blandensis]